MTCVSVPSGGRVPRVGGSGPRTGPAAAARPKACVPRPTDLSVRSDLRTTSQRRCLRREGTVAAQHKPKAVSSPRTAVGAQATGGASPAHPPRRPARGPPAAARRRRHLKNPRYSFELARTREDTAFVAETLPLPCISTLPSRLGHCLCLVIPHCLGG